MAENKSQFLQQLAIFEGLEPEQLLDLCEIAIQHKFQKGSIVAYQRDLVDCLFIVAEGTLESFEVDKLGMVVKNSPHTRIYGAGDYFNEAWMIEKSIHPATIRAATDGMMYTINQEDFDFFLEMHPTATLDLKAETWNLLDKSNLTKEESAEHTRTSLQPGEIARLESRRSPFLLALLLIFPITLLILLPSIVFVLLGVLLNLSIRSPWLIVSLVLSALFPLAFAIFRYIDWSNDYLLITNRHLVHREFDLTTFSSKTTKLPIDQIQSIQIEKPNFLENWAGMGTLRITTSAQKESLVFDRIDKPDSVEKEIASAKTQESLFDTERTRSAMRQSIEKYFNVPAQYQPTEPPKPARVLTRRGRAEVGTTVTYHRHWVVLAQQIWLNVLFFLVQFGLIAVFYVAGQWHWFFSLFAVIVSLLNAGIIYYRYVDWDNDLFQINGSAIIDIDRRPFGLEEKSQKADIMNVQDVSIIYPNFLATLLQFGNIVIKTAGADSGLVFEDVTNPERVQSDIFARRAELVKSRRVQDAVGRRKEFLLMLDEYHILQEQLKIPRRTPGLDETLKKSE